MYYCLQCKATYSIRQGTIFSSSKLSLQLIMKIIRRWCAGISGKQCHNMLGSEISLNSVYQWYSICRKITRWVLETNKVKFNGSGVLVEDVVEIEESMMGKNQKYHRGKYSPRRWVFGISKKSNHKCYLTFVNNRTQTTLM